MTQPFYPQARVAAPADSTADDYDTVRFTLIVNVANAMTRAGVPSADVRLFWDSADQFTSYRNVLNEAQRWVTIDIEEGA